LNCNRGGVTIQTPAASLPARRSANRPRWQRLAGWLLVGVAAFYALFALTAAAQTAAVLLGLAEPAQTRAAPPLFVVHAVTGAAALLTASVQLGVLGTPPAARQRGLHRVLGRLYVVSALITSTLGVPVVVAFDVDYLSKAAFLGEAALWLVTTLVAYLHIRAGRVGRHREWMIRSFALTAFFITFSGWDPVLAALPLPPATAFAVAVVLGWLLNLIVAEVWIRRTRKERNGS
jgi:uncharacterized membrane protein